MEHYGNTYGVHVIFENDINAAVIGYYSYGISREADHMVGIYFPRIYDPGAGIIINGEIYRGVHNFAGELSRIPVAYSWKELEHANVYQVTKSMGELLVICSCVLAPDFFVLHGDFWTEEIKSGLKEAVENSLQGQYEAKLVFLDDLEKDFEQEMNVPISYGGIISMIISGGTIVSSLLSSKLIKKLGTGWTTGISVLMTAVALLGFSVSNEYWMLCVLAIPLGLGAGSVDATLNNFVALHYK